MKTFILLLLITGSCFADTGFKMYHYTFTTKSEKCAVDIYVPDTGKIKIEKSCFTFQK